MIQMTFSKRAVRTGLFAVAAMASVAGCSAPLEESDADSSNDALSNADAVRVESELLPYFNPAVLVATRYNAFAPNERVDDVGRTTTVRCQLERTQGWRYARRIEEGTRFGIASISMISGPVATAESRKVGFRGFLDEIDDRGRLGDSAQMALVCFGRADDYVPTIADVTEAFARGGGPLGLGFELKLSKRP